MCGGVRVLKDADDPNVASPDPSASDSKTESAPGSEPESSPPNVVDGPAESATESDATLTEDPVSASKFEETMSDEPAMSVKDSDATVSEEPATSAESETTSSKDTAISDGESEATVSEEPAVSARESETTSEDPAISAGESEAMVLEEPANSSGESERPSSKEPSASEVEGLVEFTAETTSSQDLASSSSKVDDPVDSASKSKTKSSLDLWTVPTPKISAVNPFKALATSSAPPAVDTNSPAAEAQISPLNLKRLEKASDKGTETEAAQPAKPNPFDLAAKPFTVGQIEDVWTKITADHQVSQTAPDTLNPETAPVPENTPSNPFKALSTPPAEHIEAAIPPQISAHNPFSTRSRVKVTENDDAEHESFSSTDSSNSLAPFAGPPSSPTSLEPFEQQSSPTPLNPFAPSSSPGEPPPNVDALPRATSWQLPAEPPAPSAWDENAKPAAESVPRELDTNKPPNWGVAWQTTSQRQVESPPGGSDLLPPGAEPSRPSSWGVEWQNPQERPTLPPFAQHGEQVDDSATSPPNAVTSSPPKDWGMEKISPLGVNPTPADEVSRPAPRDWRLGAIPGAAPTGQAPTNNMSGYAPPPNVVTSLTPASWSVDDYEFSSPLLEQDIANFIAAPPPDVVNRPSPADWLQNSPVAQPESENDTKAPPPNVVEYDTPDNWGLDWSQKGSQAPQTAPPKQIGAAMPAAADYDTPENWGMTDDENEEAPPPKDSQSDQSASIRKLNLGQVFSKRAGRSSHLTGNRIPAFSGEELGFTYEPKEPSPDSERAKTAAADRAAIEAAATAAASVAAVTPTKPKSGFLHATFTRLRALVPSELLHEEKVEEPAELSTLGKAKFEFQRGQFEAALVLYEKALAAFDAEPTPDLKELCHCLADLTDVYMMLGRPQDALAAAKRLYLLDSARPKDKNYILVLMKNAEAAERAGNADGATENYLEAAELAKVLLSPDDPLQARLNKHVVEVNRRQQKYSLDEIEKIRLEAAERALQERDKIRPTHEFTFEDLKEKRSLWERIFHNPLMNSAPLVTVLAGLLFVLIVGTVSALHPERHTDVITNSGPKLAGQKFESADHQKSFTFAAGSKCKLSRYGHDFPGVYKALNGSWNDLRNMVVGSMRNPQELWLQMTEPGLVDQDGTILYKADAPELRVAARMQWYADFATAQYRKSKLYPADSADYFKDQSFKYSNAFTGKSDHADIMLKRFAAPDKSWTQKVKAGQKWEGETPARPGAIQCLCLDHCRFFVRGYDRNNQPLTSSEPHLGFTIELQDGTNVTGGEWRRLADAQPDAGDPVHVYVSTSPNMQALAASLRSMPPTCLWLATTLCAIVVAFKYYRSKKLDFITIGIAVALLAVLGFWYYCCLGMSW